MGKTMNIEVAVAPGSTTKHKGDLLENLAEKLLVAQSYKVTKEIRFTGIELDLLCKHTVSGRNIYVECKAYRDNIDANIIKNLAGSLFIKGYDEAWLISTAELGKEAKGIVDEWKKPENPHSSKLSFYTPELVISSLINSSTIIAPPRTAAQELVGSKNLLGEWTLLISSYGDFWLCTKLLSGIPSEVLAFYAADGQSVEDEGLLTNLSQTDCSLAQLKFVSPSTSAGKVVSDTGISTVDVATVQYGDSWSDYRPSRPEDFVGREKDQRAILDFFGSVITDATATRVFAFTGDSGMGKSSLVAKIVDRAKGFRRGKKIFAYAVDLRAATSPAYIYSALLLCLRAAQESGFGNPHIDINISDISSPLNSSSVKEYLESVERNEQLIVLILDQFEELYTKPELYDIFERARSLLLACAALRTNFCLGFAWKADSNTPDGHPAYFFWHSLSDYRFTRKLAPFSDQDSNAALNVFEKQLGQRLDGDLRHNLLVSSQGYPWLLKKLSIHLYEKIKDGIEQKDLLENELDVGSLFDDDLKQLSSSERACLDFVAQRAPVDWFEVTETSTPETITSLIHRRLVVKSGDRLNIYWDIFREYLLTKKVPVIPLRYLPSTDFSSVWHVVKSLSHESWTTVADIATKSGFSEGTVQNIGTDINMFGIALREEGRYLLAPEIDITDAMSLARKARDKFRRHAFTIFLRSMPSNTLVTVRDAEEFLKGLFPNSTYASATWHAYTVRLCRWLELCGLLNSVEGGWTYRDKGDVKDVSLSRRRQKVGYTPATSPAATVQCLDWLRSGGGSVADEKLPHGYTGSVRTIVRFGLATWEAGSIKLNEEALAAGSSAEEILKVAAKKEPSLQVGIAIIDEHPDVSSEAMGRLFSERMKLDWSAASHLRCGRPMKQWAIWLAE